MVRTKFILATFLLSATACSTDLDDRTGLENEASCVGFCGEQAPSGCYCDEDCAQHGDCCEDAAAMCVVAAAHGCDDNGGENELCFPGPNNNHDVCFPLANPGNPSGYNYPSPLNNNYRAPIAYLDLSAIDSGTKIAANFTLGEVAQEWKGRYAVVQPHAIARLQRMREQAGALKVNSGYRRPAYNSQVGGATRSRHMYGDAFDIDPVGISVNALEPICTSNGGKLVEYTSHVHCDWRNDPQDSKLFGSPALSGDAADDFAASPELTAKIVETDGVFTAPGDGFDEGEPVRRWTAWSADDDVLAESTGPEFVAPAGTVTVSVDVGRAATASLDL